MVGMPRSIRFRISAVLLAGAFCSAPAPAQFYDPTYEENVYLESGVPRKKIKPPLKLSFTLLEEIPLPGPLGVGGPRLREDRIEIPVAEGWLVAPWPAGPEPRLRRTVEPQSQSEPGPEYTVGPSGKYRFRLLPGNRILAEKRCPSCRNGWRRAWKLRVAGRIPSPPLISGRRVFFGTLDNRVYSVKKRNGHRVWATDVGGRVSGELVLWSEASHAAVLVIPDRGTRIVALDPISGTEVASFSLTETGSKLVGAPLSTPDGKIVAATQKYAPSDASLVVLRLDPVAPSSDEEPQVLYNGDSNASGPTPAR